MINKIIVLIKSLFVKNKIEEPTLYKAWAMLYDNLDQVDDILFYLSQVKDFEMTDTQKKYLEKGSFNMLSFRDELKIELNERNNIRSKKI